jgi:DNA primase catalytic subunit
MVNHEAVGLYEFLAKQFSLVRVVYSGRGFHLHVLDRVAYQLSTQQRQELVQKVKKAGFHVDAWVTSGEMRLIRLPYSLNGLVSRIVLPLTKGELESFNPIHDERALPRFLSSKVTF